MSKKNMAKKNKKTISRKSVVSRPPKRISHKNNVVIAIIIVIIILASFALINLLYEFSTVGKAINKPSPPVDLTLKRSETLDLSAYDRMVVKVKLSGEAAVSDLLVQAAVGETSVYYKLFMVNSVAASGF
ncbi:MAG: hypothetical protein AABX05_04895 [Nanoarchaeota archaeon]